jgi:hypothetical protein
MHRPARATLIVVLGAVLVACSRSMGTEPPLSEPPISATPISSQPGSAESTPTAGATATAPSDALLAVELRDVRSGETFTLGELAASSGPVLLEPMAVWCSNCRAQQHEVVRAHETGEFASVSLDVDLSELPADLAAYADQEGFDWYFAMADLDLYRSLQDRFGVAVTNPPSTPLIIIGVDGSVRPLEFGQGTRSAEELLSELGAS